MKTIYCYYNSYHDAYVYTCGNEFATRVQVQTGDVQYADGQPQAGDRVMIEGEISELQEEVSLVSNTTPVYCYYNERQEAYVFTVGDEYATADEIYNAVQERVVVYADGEPRVGDRINIGGKISTH